MSKSTSPLTLNPSLDLMVSKLPSREHLYPLLPDENDVEKWAKLNTIINSIKRDFLDQTLDAISTNVQQLKPLPGEDAKVFWQNVGEVIFTAIKEEKNDNPLQTAIKKIEDIRIELEALSPPSRYRKFYPSSNRSK